MGRVGPVSAIVRWVKGNQKGLPAAETGPITKLKSADLSIKKAAALYAALYLKKAPPPSREMPHEERS